MSFNLRHRSVPELNTTSTADISFMLLVFFLVTTSMDTDKGLPRQLPPADKVMQQEETTVEKGTLLRLTVTADNRLLINDEPVDFAQAGGRIEDFLKRVGERHLLSVDCDSRASYDAYFHLQNAIVSAYGHWRDTYALKKYGKRYDALSPALRDEVDKRCPQRIAEQYHGRAEGGRQ